MLVLLPLAALGQPPTLAQLINLAPWLALVTTSFLIPTMTGIYWGSRHVDPGRLGILLQMEAVMGIASAALFSGEPFRVRQAFGAALVIGAGVVEVAGHRPAPRPREALPAASEAARPNRWEPRRGRPPHA